MKIQKTLLLISLSAASIAYANDFNMRVPLKDNLSSWTHENPIYHTWENIGSLTSCGLWHPSIFNQTENFYQSSSCIQKQERDVEIREKDSFSEKVITKDIRTEYREINSSIERLVSVDVSDWIYDGDLTSDTGWTPDGNSVGFGLEFTQTRSWVQPESQLINYSVDNDIISSIKNERNSFVSDSRLAIGQGKWINTASTFTDWENSGSPYDYSAWNPSAGLQISNYTQTRSYKTDQKRFEQKKELDEFTGFIRDSGSAIEHTQTLTSSESELVSVTWSSWVNSGAHYSCSSWSPTADTVAQGVNFNQTRNCSQNQTRNRIYSSKGINFHQVGESKTITETETQASVGTKKLKWTYVGNETYLQIYSEHCGVYSYNNNNTTESNPSGQTCSVQNSTLYHVDPSTIGNFFGGIFGCGAYHWTAYQNAGKYNCQ